ncbi:MAG TPA: LA2681 family HEPN domain-containing protein [Chryseosolibacter sp.]
MIQDNPKKVFLIPVEFFENEGFLERLTNQLAHFRARIRSGELKEIVQDELNAFFIACMSSALSDDKKTEAQLLFYGTLNFYAQQYRSAQTFKNIIKAFESNDLKQKLFSKFPTRAKMTYAETLFQYYSLIKNNEPIFSFDKTDLLIQAKYYLWKVYIHHIEQKTRLSKLDLSHCLTILSMCLGELSRWFEPLYYLQEAKSQVQQNPNVAYSRALILETIKEKTCLNFNAVLVLSIIDSCREAVKRPAILPQQKEQLQKMELAGRKFLAKQKQSAAKIRAHRSKIQKAFKTYSAYRKFCIHEQLYLNEHSLFCNCAKATADTLRVETSHAHTKIPWVKQFENLIDVFVADFSLARQNYYYSQDDVKLPRLIAKSHQRHQTESLEKAALLKNSFKAFYSLLDQIGHAVFQVFGIDANSELQKKFPDGNQRPKLYFLNMWDFELLNEDLFSKNFYLISLYSISQDLNNSKYAALKDFKTIRNGMEHKLFCIGEELDEAPVIEGISYYTKHELSQKNRILMILTKSAIMSFTYLVRRQSRILQTHEPHE